VLSYFREMLHQNLMAGISSEAAVFLVLETGFFLFLVFSIRAIEKNINPILAQLSRSLRLSEDLFGDERNFVTSARTRYRRAAERIEAVDANAIASGELSSYEALRLWKWRISMGALAEIMGSAPGVFITIGLLGTFLGLATNLSELGLILSVGDESSSASPGDLIDRLGGILAPMSTAFISSLGGIFYSLLFWVTGLVMGANRVAIESETLLVAYLEQIVQADCNRFSLLRASVERMELCLAEFMSMFSDRVGQAIDNAMSQKIDGVFNAIKAGSSALSIYSETMHQGVESLAKSGKVFYESSIYFRDSTFPSEFSHAMELFLSSAGLLSSSASQLSSDLSEISSTKASFIEDWNQAQSALVECSRSTGKLMDSFNEYTRKMDSSLQELSDSAKQLRLARLAIGKENKLSDELSRSLLDELEKGKLERTSLLTTLQTLIVQMENRKTIDEKLASLIESNLTVEGLSRNERRRLMGLIDQLTKT
jgi:hypothetical protein